MCGYYIHRWCTRYTSCYEIACMHACVHVFWICYYPIDGGSGPETAIDCTRQSALVSVWMTDRSCLLYISKTDNFHPHSSCDNLNGCRMPVFINNNLKFGVGSASSPCFCSVVSIACSLSSSGQDPMVWSPALLTLLVLADIWLPSMLPFLFWPQQVHLQFSLVQWFAIYIYLWY